MTTPQLEILDWVETPIGSLCLRRRSLLSRPGTEVTEVTLAHELLMSSLHTQSEEELARRAIAFHGGRDLDVLVGGLGLGYTAQAALETGRAAHVRVIELLPEVIGWLDRGLVPLAATLETDVRFAVDAADVYALLLGPADRQHDLILIDVDHSPTEPLWPGSEPFYTADGLARVALHLEPGGVLAVWSSTDDDPFQRALESVFAEATRETVRWRNDLIEDEPEQEETLFLARRAGYRWDRAVCR